MRSEALLEGWAVIEWTRARRWRLIASLHAVLLRMCVPALLVGSSHSQGGTAAPSLGFTQDFVIQYPQDGVYALLPHGEGAGSELYVGGDFTAITGHQPFISPHIVRWDGSVWSNVGGGFGWTDSILQLAGEPGVYSLCTFDGGMGPQLFAGGNFNRAGGAQGEVPCSGFMRWDGVSWSIESIAEQGMPAWVRSMVVFDDGSGSALYPAGRCSFGFVKRWNGQSWTSMGSSVSLLPATSTNLRLYHYAIFDDGGGTKLYAMGNFSTVEGQAANGFCVWDGVQWSPILGPWGTSPDSVDQFARNVYCSAVFDDGSGPALYFGSERLYRYRSGVVDLIPVNGSFAGYFGVRALHAYDDGNGPALFVGARLIEFQSPSGVQYARFARWDGSVWSPIGELLPSVGFGNVWTSCTWNRGDGEDLYFGGLFGSFTGGLLSPHIVRYRGVHRDLALVCGGDGALSPCPCNTLGDVGHGCPNSVNAGGAELQPRATAGLDTLRLEATSLPPSTMCILQQGTAYDYASRKFGDGVSCTVGTQLRLMTKQAEAGVVSFGEPGDGTIRERAALQGDLLPSGAVRYYQAWYRDPDPAFCASGGLLNLTNGVRVVW